MITMSIMNIVEKVNLTFETVVLVVSVEVKTFQLMMLLVLTLAILLMADTTFVKTTATTIAEAVEEIVKTKRTNLQEF